MIRQVKYEEKIRGSSKGSKRVKFERRAQCPEMDANLHVYGVQRAEDERLESEWGGGDGETYTDTGEKSMWVHGGGSGLDKPRCTVQLTLFADGEQQVKPLVIFRGKGQII